MKEFKEIVTKVGVLKYRDPNVLEIFMLLEKSGISKGESSELVLKQNIIAAMAPMINFSSIENCNSYEELLDDTENMTTVLGEVANELIDKVFGAFKKKT